LNQLADTECKFCREFYAKAFADVFDRGVPA